MSVANAGICVKFGRWVNISDTSVYVTVVQIQVMVKFEMAAAVIMKLRKQLYLDQFLADVY